MSTQTQLAPVDGADQNAMSRQEAARQACEAAGIVWPGTILPPGTALYSSGVEKLKNDRAAWRRLPKASEVVGLVAAALASEDRRDFPINVHELRLRPTDGRIVRSENVGNPDPMIGLGYGPHSFRQLMAQVDPLDPAPRGFANALLFLTDQERAEIVNKRIGLTKDSTSVVLRTKMPHRSDGGRIARAALSKVYGSVTDHDIAGIIGEVLSEMGDTSAKLDYKPGDSASRFELIWPSEIPVDTFVVGDVHYLRLGLDNSETGEGGVDILGGLLRAACANLTLSEGEGVSETVRHVGDPVQLKARIRRAIRRAVDELEPLIRTITMSAKIPVGAWSVEEALTKIAKRFGQTEGAAASWNHQLQASNYPATIWGIGAAISEAAHGQETWLGEAEWEKVAAKVQRKAVEVVMAGTPAAMALEKALQVN